MLPPASMGCVGEMIQALAQATAKAAVDGNKKGVPTVEASQREEPTTYLRNVCEQDDLAPM